MENELPYRRSIFENDFRSYSSKLMKNSNDDDDDEDENDYFELVENQSQELLKRYYQVKAINQFSFSFYIIIILVRALVFSCDNKNRPDISF